MSQKEIQGTRFICPSCNYSVVDNWVTNPHKGSVIKCPLCKTGYRLLKEPNEKTPGEMLEKIIESFEEKLKALNLLPITKNMVAYIAEIFPLLRNYDSFDYVKFDQSSPYFYSKKYIEENTIPDLLHSFAKITREIPCEIDERPDDAEPGIQLGNFMPERI